ncbi:MAG: alpha/beta fold hydrolase [bacterium]|nr:alpha/beta fold hydrolase [bacterium]
MLVHRMTVTLLYEIVHQEKLMVCFTLDIVASTTAFQIVARKNFCRISILVIFISSLLSIDKAHAEGSAISGNYQYQLVQQGKNRSYFVHIPPHESSAILPVVIYLHGGGGNASQFRHDNNSDAAADKFGYIAVYPNGSGVFSDKLLTWNAGHCCGYAQKNNIDDVGFIIALLGNLESRVIHDKTRLYLAGHSNGAMMAYRIAQERPDRIAAIAAVAAVRPTEKKTTRVIPILQIHSIDDPRAPYNGGIGPRFPYTNHRVKHYSVPESILSWVKNNGCRETPSLKERRTNNSHTAELYTYGECIDNAEVQYWRLTGAGHGWPGSETGREDTTGPATKVIDANEVIWEFFKQQSAKPIIE